MADEPLTGAARPTASDAGRPAAKGTGGRGFFAAIGLFLRQIIDELRKVVTPTAKELFFWSLAVFIFVLLLMALVTGMDFGLGKATLWVFG